MNKAFLYEMLRTESVSGGEIPLQKKVAAYMREQGAEVETDLAGDVISSINSASPFFTEPSFTAAIIASPT